MNIRDYVEYFPETGIFIWKKSPTPRIKVGDGCGSSHGCGYITITVMQKSYLAHRLAWFLTYGEWPINDIDHIDGDRKNNKITNLRGATRQENLRNTGSRKNKTSNYKGVSWDKTRCKWVAYIKFNGKVKNLGRFNNEEDAALEYNKWAKEKFGVYGVLNNIHPAISDQAIMV